MGKPLYISGHAIPYMNTCGLCSDPEFTLRQRYDALTTDGTTSSVSRPARRLTCMWVPVSNSQSHLHSHRSLDRVAEMLATSAGATVSNAAGMIGAEAGLSGQTQ